MVFKTQFYFFPHDIFTIDEATPYAEGILSFWKSCALARGARGVCDVLQVVRAHPTKTTDSQGAARAAPPPLRRLGYHAALEASKISKNPLKLLQNPFKTR